MSRCPCGCNPRFFKNKRQKKGKGLEHICLTEGCTNLGELIREGIRKDFCSHCRYVGSILTPRVILTEDERYIRQREGERRRRLKIIGWTLDRFVAFNYAQGGLCYLCGESDFSKGLNKVLSADHDHETGESRGLLCTACNTSIQMIEEKSIYDLVGTYLGHT